MSVRDCDVRLARPVSAGWPLTLPTCIVLRAPAVHGVSSYNRDVKNPTDQQDLGVHLRYLYSVDIQLEYAVGA